MSSAELARQYRIRQWMEAIRDQKASGLTIRQWCEKNSVTRGQFFYHQRAVRLYMAEALQEHLESTGTSVACQETGKTNVPANTPGKPAAEFVQVPQQFMSETSGAVMRIRRGKATDRKSVV